jgi:hypothetical protein
MDAEIIVDGKSIDLNEFVKRITFSVTVGLVNSLHDIPEWSKIEIKLER